MKKPVTGPEAGKRGELAVPSRVISRGDCGVEIGARRRFYESYLWSGASIGNIVAGVPGGS